MHWTITNIDSGLVLGTYEGDTPAEALDAMARDAGYPSHKDACLQGEANLEVSPEPMRVNVYGQPRARYHAEQVDVATWAEAREHARHLARTWGLASVLLGEAGDPESEYEVVRAED